MKQSLIPSYVITRIVLSRRIGGGGRGEREGKSTTLPPAFSIYAFFVYTSNGRGIHDDGYRGLMISVIDDDANITHDDIEYFCARCFR